VLALIALACRPTVSTPTATDAAPETAAGGLGVVINEVQTRNDSTATTDDGEFADWVELYNSGETTSALGRLGLRAHDDTEGSDETAWSEAAGELAPGEHLRLWADRDLPFGLSGSGESLTLLLDDEPVDWLSTGEMVADTAWARIPDGADWVVNGRPTPGWTNGSAASADPADALFGRGHVSTISLWVHPSTIAQLNEGSEVPARMGFGAATFEQVGLRRKGGIGSARHMHQKTGLKIDLNEYDDHRLRGLEGLTINNMVQDPTYAAEYLSYLLFRDAGVPAPRVGYTWVRVNEEDFGLYALLEPPDDTFLRYWWADGDGVLYEAAYGVDLIEDDIDRFEVDEGEPAEDRADLRAAAAALTRGTSDNDLIAVDALIDMDEVLDALAVEALALHWDGYAARNNYRLYINPVGGRIEYLPWGTDQTFIDAEMTPWDGTGRLYTFCIANPTCAARYDAALLDAADRMEALDLEGELDALLEVLGPWIDADPRAEWSPEARAAYLEIMRQNIREAPGRVRGR